MPARRRFGSVRRLPSGRWQARYWDAAGNRVGAPTTFATKGDAQRWLSAAETDQSRGDWHDPRLGDVPFSEWAERWMATKAPTLGPATQDLYRYLLRKHVVPRFGAMAVGRITASEVQAWLAVMHRTELSPNTVAKAYRCLSGVMDGAVDAGLIARSPCTLKGAGTERHAEMQIATPEQVAELAAAVGPRWEALVFAAAYTGLRWGELAGLRRCDVDLERNLISVTRKLAEVNGELSFSPPKTAAGKRTIGMPSFVARSLAVHIDLYALRGADGLVFPSADGQPMRRSNFRRRLGTGDQRCRHERLPLPRPQAHRGDARRRQRDESQGAHGPHRARVSRCRAPVPARDRRPGRRHRPVPRALRRGAARALPCPR